MKLSFLLGVILSVSALSTDATGSADACKYINIFYIKSISLFSIAKSSYKLGRPRPVGLLFLLDKNLMFDLILCRATC